MKPEYIVPDWDAPGRVRALSTTRNGGVSAAPYGSFNLGLHVDDKRADVLANRALLRGALPEEPKWLDQVHGVAVVDAGMAGEARCGDAAVARRSGAVCAVMTADCLPVLLCDRRGTVVAAAHAGWRGLLAGVLENCVERMAVPGAELLAWLGPAIGPDAFEVGAEVRSAFVERDAEAATAFRPGERSGKWMADLYALARMRLSAAGVGAVWGGEYCTCSDSARFFSYRRDGVTGRMASLIWLE